VDHAYPFSKILEQWLDIEELDFESMALGRSGELKDKNMVARWYNYHKKVAILQLVDKTANLKKGAKY
jgi:hypothetical protein